MVIIMKYVDKTKKYFLETGSRFPREVIWAISIIKYCAAWANKELKVIPEGKAEVIMKIAMDMAKGNYDDLITVDIYGTGSGTGLNMNINEAIAKIAEEKYGYKLHPNDDVNRSQSSNDVIPTAIRMATIKVVEERITPELKKLIDSLETTTYKTYGIVKAGRTHLRDALPITYGMEFNGYLSAFNLIYKKLESALDMIREVPIGGTAVGTGFHAPKEYGSIVINKINEITKLGLKKDVSKTRSMKLVTDIIFLSAILRSIAIDLWRLCQDLRLMYSGPKTGIGEINIDIKIIGSSTMPGKKNPVTLEAVIQACSRVIGLDISNMLSGLIGEFELSLSFPLLIHNIVEQCKLLAEAMRKMYKVVLPNITINIEKSKRYAITSSAILTLLSPKLGYDKVANIVDEIDRGGDIKEVLAKYGVSISELEDLLRRYLESTDWGD